MTATGRQSPDAGQIPVSPPSCGSMSGGCAALRITRRWRLQCLRRKFFIGNLTFGENALCLLKVLRCHPNRERPDARRRVVNVYPRYHPVWHLHKRQQARHHRGRRLIKFPANIQPIAFRHTRASLPQPSKGRLAAVSSGKRVSSFGRERRYASALPATTSRCLSSDPKPPLMNVRFGEARVPKPRQWMTNEPTEPLIASEVANARPLFRGANCHNMLSAPATLSLMYRLPAASN